MNWFLSQDITLRHSSDLTFADLVHRLVALNRLTSTTGIDENAAWRRIVS